MLGSVYQRPQRSRTEVMDCHICFWSSSLPVGASVRSCALPFFPCAANVVKSYTLSLTPRRSSYTQALPRAAVSDFHLPRLSLEHDRPGCLSPDSSAQPFDVHEIDPPPPPQEQERQQRRGGYQRAWRIVRTTKLGQA